MLTNVFQKVHYFISGKLRLFCWTSKCTFCWIILLFKIICSKHRLFLLFVFQGVWCTVICKTYRGTCCCSLLCCRSYFGSFWAIKLLASAVATLLVILFVYGWSSLGCLFPHLALFGLLWWRDTGRTIIFLTMIWTWDPHICGPLLCILHQGN